MSIIRFLFFLLCFGLITCTGGMAGASGVLDFPNGPDSLNLTPPYAEGYVLVKADPASNNSQNSLSAINTAIGAAVSRDYATLGFPGLTLMKLSDNMSVEQAVEYYSGQAGVAYAEPDYYVSIASEPNDPDFWREWGLSNTGLPFRENTTPGTPGADIHALSAWNSTTGMNGAVVAVVDTGADIGHPDLSDNLWTWNESGIVIHGYNVLVSDWAEPWDDNGHGTHCAGIIGMIGNNRQGGTGVAWNASIMAIKVFNSMGSAKTSDIIAGMAYASNRKVPVISCSFGGTYPSRAMAELIGSSSSLFVCAAGNSKIDTTSGGQSYPACYNLSNVLAVASSGVDDNLSWFSNYGNKTIHVAAPGEYIYSSIPSTYSWNTFFDDPGMSSDNFTLTGDWTTVIPETPGEPRVIHGDIPSGTLNTSLIIESNQSFLVPGDAPIISWDEKGTLYGKERIEYSVNGAEWAILKDDSGAIQEKDWTCRFATFYSVPAGSSIKFQITSNLEGSGDKADIFIRNIRLGYRESVTIPNYAYYNGTSMATPMVSGMAGLIKGAAPDLTAYEIKQVIIDTVDPIPSLKDKIVSGGRVNLSAALESLSAPDAIPLKAGWNHVSVPRNLASGSDTARIFDGVNSSGHSILMYQNDTAGYRTLNASDPIVLLQGYWLFSENSTIVPVRFEEPVHGSSRNIPAGWSSVGGWADQDISANETFHTLMTNWSYAVGYDADVQQYEEPIIRGGTGNQSDNRTVYPYLGYWLYCSQNGTYQTGFG